MCQQLNLWNSVCGSNGWNWCVTATQLRNSYSLVYAQYDTKKALLVTWCVVRFVHNFELQWLAHRDRLYVSSPVRKTLYSEPQVTQVHDLLMIAHQVSHECVMQRECVTHIMDSVTHQKTWIIKPSLFFTILSMLNGPFYLGPSNVYLQCGRVSL